MSSTTTFRTARRGAARGPSGMRNEHLRPLLDNAEDCTKFFEISGFCTDESSRRISALRIGQMTAVQKANGGIRGVVVGDVIRRLVAKTMKQSVHDMREYCTRCAGDDRPGPKLHSALNRWCWSFR